MRKHTAPAPWQELEQQAYHAYREWPLWLVLRERELTERITHGRPIIQPPEPPSDANLERKAPPRPNTPVRADARPG